MGHRKKCNKLGTSYEMLGKMKNCHNKVENIGRSNMNNRSKLIIKRKYGNWLSLGTERIILSNENL